MIADRKTQIEDLKSKPAAIVALDRAYYEKSNPTRAERAEYHWRKD